MDFLDQLIFPGKSQRSQLASDSILLVVSVGETMREHAHKHMLKWPEVHKRFTTVILEKAQQSR